MATERFILIKGLVMREIKFRCWNTKDNEFVTDYNTGGYSSVEFGDGYVEVMQTNLVDELVNGEHEQFEDFIKIKDGIEVMQFTGLLDKEGVDIYEGDILRVLMTDWPSKSNSDPRTISEYMNGIASIYVVGFDKGAFSMSLNNNGELNHYIFCGRHGFIEVIGNIHENPDLL